MAWLYEKSAVWRGIVAVTAASPWAMAGFTGVSLGAAYYMGKGFMWLTEKDPELARKQLAKHDDRMSSQVSTPDWPGRSQRHMLLKAHGVIECRQASRVYSISQGLTHVHRSHCMLGCWD